jgi:hypothetical protein
MPDTFLQLLSRIGAAALARATFAIVLCIGLALMSRKGMEGVLPALMAAYAVLGTFAFSRAVRAEIHKVPEEAASLYMLALVYWFVSYVSALTISL